MICVVVVRFKKNELDSKIKIMIFITAGDFTVCVSSIQIGMAVQNLKSVNRAPADELYAT